MTLLDAEKNILLSPEDMYASVYAKAEQEASVSLLDADVVVSEFSGRQERDMLPTVPKRAMDTGLLPPVEDSMIIYKEVFNKNALGLEKYKALVSAGSMSLADTKGYRIRTAYRLVRQMARIRGTLFGWERLQPVLDGMGICGLPGWSVPDLLGEAAEITGYRAVRNLLRHMETGDCRYTFNTPEGMRTLKGATFLPPPLPDSCYPSSDPKEIWRMRVEGVVPPGYHPQNDLNLCLYCEAMYMVSHQLCVEFGAKEEPWSGIYGTAGLFNPGIARQAWPTRDELVLYEEELLLHVFDRVVRMSEIQVQKYMENYFGFNRFEAVDIVKTAMEVARILYREDAETMRTVVLKRIERIADSCVDACNLREELAAVKLKSQILGLTANEENESMATLRDAHVNALRRREEEEPEE